MVQINQGAWSTLIANTSSPALSAAITGLAAGSSYSFQVAAMNAVVRELPALPLGSMRYCRVWGHSAQAARQSPRVSFVA